MNEYNSYAESFIKDGMVPLSFSEWQRVQTEAEEYEAAYES